MKKGIITILSFLPNVSLAAARSVDSLEVNFVSIVITFVLMYLFTYVVYWVVLYSMKKLNKKFDATKLFLPVFLATVVGFFSIVLAFILLDWASVTLLMISAIIALIGLTNFLICKYYLLTLDKNQSLILAALVAVLANPIVWLVLVNYIR